MKKIILIDDDIKKVEKIFVKICKMLWKKKDEDGIAAKVIFFGDQFKREKSNSDLQQQNIDDFYRKIKSMLLSHCQDEEEWESNGNMYKEKKKLIDKMVKNISIGNGEDKIKEIVEVWQDKEKLKSFNDLTEIDFEPLINLILGEEKSQVEQYILIDVILLWDDMNQIELDIPIISMGLYNALKSQQYMCYLYSSYKYNYPLMENYKEIYRKRYKEEVSIYNSNDFFSENIYSKQSLFYYLNERGK